ncbi:hypothetical protein [Sphingomonas sp. BK235]|uniref:hypothetical protein n=1 Tax=Sphingomonas sp. BK235 TaxID=2512131 RepID=UPI00104CB0E8|nr:hypothetical protein [Sphingomonas sp. BK235]TCP34823.1 hypothetical protein EV292_103250 [Sphingomonas sp. BK235]
MTITFAGLLSVAWRLFRRDRALVVSLAAPFVFLPAFAALLLCDPLPPLPPAPRDEIMMRAWLAAVGQWGQANALFYVVADLIAVYGIAAIALLLLDPDRLTVGQALGQALARLWSFALVTLAVAVPVGLGMWLLVLPGLYVQARLIAALPALARHPALRAAPALRLSWRMTRGRDWAITGALVTLFLAQWVAVSPLLLADEALRAPGRGDPVLLALVDALLALVPAIYSVATVLVGVVVYRVGASRGS